MCRAAVCLIFLLSTGTIRGEDAALTEFSMAVITQMIEAAEPGETVRVPRGRYVGALVIRQSVVLDGSAGAVLDGEGAGTVVEIHAENVTFRGFRVRGSSGRVEGEPAGIRVETGPVQIENNTLEDVLFGIDLRQSPDSVVRGNTISGMPLEPGRRGDGIRLWWSHGCTIEENRLIGTRDAVFWYSEGLLIRKNHVSGGRYGLHFMYSHRTKIEDNLLEDNSVGVYLMYSNDIALTDNCLRRNRGTSGYGIGLKDCDDIHCESNQILSNRVGIYIDRCPFSMDGSGVFTKNRFAYNETGLSMTPQTTRNRTFENAFVENEKQIAVHGRGDLSKNEFSFEGRGNFWSNYAGYDLDGDGVGDLEHRGVSLFENLLVRQPDLRLFSHSLAQRAIEFTARALPAIRPAPNFTDPSPLMQVPTRFPAPERSGPRGSMLLVCFVLLGLGAAAVAWGGKNPWVGRKPEAETEKGTSC